MDNRMISFHSIFIVEISAKEGNYYKKDVK